MCAISMLPLSFTSAYFTFSFVHQFQTAEYTIFLVMENIFHSGLDGTMILYTVLACFSHKLKSGELFTFLQPGNGRAISA
jgi:hypothetical protein